MLTTVLIPALSGGSSFWRWIAMRTGMRWVTFTQLPLAFSAGSTENADPLAALIACTWPCQVRPG